MPRDPLQTLPSVGPRIARDLRMLGFHTPADLVGADALVLYRRLEALTESKQDPCVLDTFRCAIYAASTPDPDPELLKWWTWSRLRKEGRL
jgi:hypothetical protein